LEAVHRSIQSVRPGMKVLEVSAKTGAGMDEWLQYLMTLTSKWQGSHPRQAGRDFERLFNTKHGLGAD
jgi:hypothetical protein